MASKRIVLPGGSGFLGRSLRDRLVARGDSVVVLTRGPLESGAGWASVGWDGATLGDWVAVLDGADAIVHLSGKRVDCRPTKRNLAELIASRVVPVRLVGEALAAVPSPPPVWVQLSSLARYGDSGETVIQEDTVPTAAEPPQMVRVCTEWEEAFASSSRQVPRTVLVRAGISIGGRGDPATARLVGLARWGLGGKVGSGRQWVSWVSLEDFLTILIRAIDDAAMTGLYHVTSPNPIRNEEMMATYRRLVGRRFGVPSPRLITEVGARVLGSDPALALTGRRAVPTRLLAEGYRFLVPDFEDAARKAVAALQ
jgi:hypothetical protein